MIKVNRIISVFLILAMTACAFKTPVITTADGLVRFSMAGGTLFWFGVDTTITSISKAVLDENGQPTERFIPEEYLTAHSTPTFVKFLEAALAAGGQIGASIFLGKRRMGGCSGDCSTDYNLNSSSGSRAESENNNINISDMDTSVR